MKNISYQGRKDVLLRTLRKCALKGYDLQRDAHRIQAELDRAQRQAEARRVLAARRGVIA